MYLKMAKKAETCKICSIIMQLICDSLQLDWLHCLILFGCVVLLTLNVSYKFVSTLHIFILSLQIYYPLFQLLPLVFPLSLSFSLPQFVAPNQVFCKYTYTLLDTMLTSICELF